MIYMIIGLLGEHVFDESVVTNVLNEVRHGMSLKKKNEQGDIYLFFDVEHEAGRVALDYAKKNGLKYISFGEDVSLSWKRDEKDEKKYYERNHQIINKSDVVVIFKEQSPSAHIQNAIRYCTRNKKDAFFVHDVVWTERR